MGHSEAEHSSHRLSIDDYLTHLRTELARLAETEASQLDHPLPHIEGWTVHAVVGHTGWVARWAAKCLATPADAPPKRSDVPEPPAGADVLPWFGESAELLNDAINAADLDEPLRTTWTGPQPGSWWIRRLAHETAMHRWDAAAAIGTPGPIDAPLALDGIDEVLETFAPKRLQFDLLGTEPSSMHLHTTDTEHGEWMVYFADGGLRWERAHAKGDVAARGSASDLLLLLWSRIPASRVEVFGDAALLDRWQAAAAF